MRRSDLGQNQWRVRTRGAGLLAGLVMTFAIIAPPADVAAAAAAGGIAVSPDGVTYAAALPGGLFDQITISVPGDSQTTEFWIRNSGPVPAYLRVAVAAVTVSDPVLADALTVAASTTAHPGTPVALSTAQPCQVLTEGDLLSPGDTVHVTARLALGDLDGLSGQGGTATFALRVGLTDSAIPLPPTSCGEDGTDIPVTDGDGDIPLAYTGAEIPLPLIIGAASILGVGLFLLVAARRRRKVEE
jgi:hypothetical protein